MSGAAATPAAAGASRGARQATPLGMAARFSKRLSALTMLAMVAAALSSMVVASVEFNASLRPFLLAKAETVAQKLRDDVVYALEIGVPFDALRGVEALAAELAERHPEVRDLTVAPGPAPRSAAETAALVGAPAPSDRPAASGVVAAFGDALAVLLGRTGAAEARVAAEIVQDGVVVGHVSAAIDEAYIVDQMRGVFFDSLVILVVVALVAVEVVVVLAGRRIVEPLRRLEIAIGRRADGDFTHTQPWGRRGPFNAFIARLNAAHGALRDRAATLIAEAPEAVAAQTRALAARRRLFERDPARADSVIDARIPLFIFCVAEELQKSFLPLFVAEHHQPSDLFDKSIMVGLPISCFMFIIAAVTPFAGALVDRYGARRLFMAGLLPALLGHLGCALATSGDQIVMARSVTALGYAVITISCQSYIAAVVSKENRAGGMAVFVGVLMAATMCGTAMGAILADWLGFKPVFLVAIALTLVAGGLGWRMLGEPVAPAKQDAAADAAPRPASAHAPGPAPRPSPLAPLARLLSNPRFVLIVLLCAIPAKIVLTGFLYLFVPIHLASLDASQSEIGRIMMLYSLIIIPISPLASRFGDRCGRNLTLVIGATIASGLALLGLYQSASTATVLAVVALLGVSHAFLKAPLIVAAMEAAEASPEVSRTMAMSLLRTLERVGSVIGPVAVAALLLRFEHQDAAAILGVAVALVGLAMAAAAIATRPESAAHA